MERTVTAMNFIGGRTHRQWWQKRKTMTTSVVYIEEAEQ
jgi:hypothetical protein